MLRFFVICRPQQIGQTLQAISGGRGRQPPAERVAVVGVYQHHHRGTPGPGLQLGQLIEQGSSSRGPGGAGFQLGEPLQQQGTA
jgi:hypothetical protein